MSSPLPPPSPLTPSPPHVDPVVRFRMRSLLVATTVVALLAAIAGPYYRSQPPERQSALLLYWSCLAIFTGIGIWYSWRDLLRVPRAAGRVQFMLWVARRRFSMLHRWPGRVVVALLWFAYVAVMSVSAFELPPRGAPGRPPMPMPTGVSVFLHGMMVMNCLTHGLGTGALVIAMMRRPVFLTENGVSLGPRGASWRHVQTAKWLPERLDVMQIRWHAGDIDVDVPPKMRDDVEAFVRAKTAFLENAWMEDSESPVGEPT